MYQSKKKSRLGDVSAYFFLLPAIVLSFLFIVVPLILTFRYSFTDWSGLGEYNNICLLYTSGKGAMWYDATSNASNLDTDDSAMKDNTCLLYTSRCV